MRRLTDRVAVVTGAASGIGRAVAVALAKEGCDVALVDIDETGLKETGRLVEAVGRNVSLHSVDVADRTAMEALPERVIDEHSRVHIVVNNAGVSVSAEIEDHSIEDFEWIMGINFWGVVYGSRFFIPYLKREDEGHIVNISSVFGLIGLPSQGSYNASKFAVRGFSEALHAELAPHGIGVTVVHPGGVDTNIVRSSRIADEADRDELQRSFERWGKPPEYAAERIVRAIRRNKIRLLVCPEAFVIDWMKRLFPAWTHRLIARMHTRGKLLV